MCSRPEARIPNADGGQRQANGVVWLGAYYGSDERDLGDLG